MTSRERRVSGPARGEGAGACEEIGREWDDDFVMHGGTVD